VGRAGGCGREGMGMGQGGGNCGRGGIVRGVIESEPEREGGVRRGLKEVGGK